MLPIPSLILTFLAQIILPFQPIQAGSMTPVSLPDSANPSACELVVVSDPLDGYHPLAEEIALVEQASLYADMRGALACSPDYLLWVTAPSSLSDPVMIEVMQALQDVNDPPAVGIITGSSIELARSLWQRGKIFPGNRFFAANAENEAAHIGSGQLMEFRYEGIVTAPLDKSALVATLTRADYLTFTGHGGGTYLAIDRDEGVRLKAEDIPALPPVVVATGSCQTVRPWVDHSISLRIVDQGAAAYSGFVYSPNSGYLIGAFGELPFRYTWKEFPIGRVIQAQTRGSMQGFASIPFHILLGDPRIALQAGPPYTVVSDSQTGDVRRIHLADVPPGAIPIRVTDGGRYSYVQIAGVTSASDGDMFYNSRLQMINHKGEKYLLVIQDGGDLSLELREKAPFLWYPLDTLFDSLDNTFVFAPQSDGDLLSMAFAIFPAGWFLFNLTKKRLVWKKVHAAILLGLAATVLHSLYCWIRIPQLTIVSKIVVISPLSLVATFLLVTLGGMLYLHAKDSRGQVLALLVCTFPCWSLLIFEWIATAGFNLLFSIPKIGTGLYNQRVALMPAFALLVSLAFLVPVCHTVKTRISTTTTGGIVDSSMDN